MHARRPSHGFTLIELLVVIAIIAILAAILFPVFLTARASAQKATCQTHQHELCQALSMYIDAYGGRMPYRRFLAYDSAPGGGYIALYHPYVKNNNIILCPVSARYVGTDGKVTVGRQAYGYNECLIGTLSTWYDGPTECYYISDFDNGSNGASGRPVASIRSASKTPAFFDAFAYKQDPNLPATGWGWQPADSVDKNRMTNPHNNGSNYAFVDGHVRWMPPALPKYFMATKGLDYDGNGTVGDHDMLR